MPTHHMKKVNCLQIEMSIKTINVGRILNFNQREVPIIILV
uniref:Uncharacterized protein n=1 Tax=Rhizophora mucronata TaxID=61149 RepID=A0A2P2L2E4_RHIMU